MVEFTSVFDDEPDLTTPEGIRSAMRDSYDRHQELARESKLPPNTSLHEASMYGVLSSYYELTGTSPATTAQNEQLLWLDLLPFLHLPDNTGLEALIEYIVWKHSDEREEARLKWLAEQVRQGTERAIEAGWEDDIERAENIGGQGPMPWIALLAEGQQT